MYDQRAHDAFNQIERAGEATVEAGGYWLVALVLDFRSISFLRVPVMLILVITKFDGSIGLKRKVSPSS